LAENASKGNFGENWNWSFADHVPFLSSDHKCQSNDWKFKHFLFIPLLVPVMYTRQFVRGRGEARGRKLKSEARMRQFTSFSRQGRGSRAKDEARNEVEISTSRQSGNLRLL